MLALESLAFGFAGSYASIDRSSLTPPRSPKRTDSAIEASTMRSALETTRVRRRNRASQCRQRECRRVRAKLETYSERELNADLRLNRSDIPDLAAQAGRLAGR